MYRIRPASPSDLPCILDLFEQARRIMRSDGNMTQWADGYPDEAAVLRDIDRGAGFVLIPSSGPAQSSDSAASSPAPAAYFAVLSSPDPTYALIEGAWLDDNPYGVIHRIASRPDAHGVMRAIMDFAFSRFASIRIDTHEDNRIMRHILERMGFVYCGIIYVADGTPRLAYQLLTNR